MKRPGRVLAGVSRLLGKKKPAEYSLWLQRNGLTSSDREKIRKAVKTLEYRPLISVIVPTFNTPHVWLRRCLDSVLAQLYPFYELCVADDASSDPRVRKIIEKYAAKSDKVKVTFRKSNGNISAASNSALELADGEFIALLDHDDELAPHALYMVAEELNRYPGADLVYSDEDKIDESGRRFDPHFKTDWNQDLFYCYNLICHLGVYRTEMVRAIGGFRQGCEGSQDYDLALRCIERIDPRRIRHIPHVLYHWRAHSRSIASTIDAKSYAVQASRNALVSHFQRKNVAVRVDCANHPGYHRIIYPLPPAAPLVSLIIPVRDSCRPLKTSIQNILRKTRYPRLELVIVEYGAQDAARPGRLEDIDGGERVECIRFNGPFNRSGINNEGVRYAHGELVGFLDNDVEVIDASWLQEMVSHALRPGVGAVGARLLYEDGRVQHAGIILGIGGVAGYAHQNLDKQDYGYFSRLQLTQNFSAVSGACLLMKRSVFDEVGGFDQKNVKVAFNDVDLCLRIRRSGYLIVWTPYAELRRRAPACGEGGEKTPSGPDALADAGYMRARWGPLLLEDPYYNPNLTLEKADFSLALCSRAGKPWLTA